MLYARTHGVKTDSHVYIVHTSSRICTLICYMHTHTYSGGVKTDSHVYIVHTSSRICTNICYMHTHIHTLREREREGLKDCFSCLLCHVHAFMCMHAIQVLTEPKITLHASNKRSYIIDMY